MSKHDKAYGHRARVPGTQPEDAPSPSKEHRETAYGNAEERNELTPDQRGYTDGYGPRTHKDTRIVRTDRDEAE